MKTPIKTKPLNKNLSEGHPGKTLMTSKTTNRGNVSCPRNEVNSANEDDGVLVSTRIAGLLLLAVKFPYRQFNSSELALISGLGRTAISRIKQAPDSPFSLGKCTLARLDAWLAVHRGFTQS